MTIYFICLFIISSIFVLTSLIKLNDVVKQKKIEYFLLCSIGVLLAIISAIRYNVGTDYTTYLKIYNDTITTVKEPGYMLINFVARFLNLSAQFPIACYSVATIYFAIKFIMDNSKKPILSILIFYTFTPFFLQTMNVIRQELAIFMFAYAIKFIKESDIKRYFLTIIIAGLFAHLTVLLTIPLYFFLNLDLSKKIRVIMFGVFLIIGPIVFSLLKYTPYAFYLNYAKNQDSISPVFVVSILLSLFLYIKTYKISESIEFKNLCFIYLCFSGLSLINYNNILFTLLERILWYFLPSILVLVPLYCYKSEKYKKIKIGIFCTLFIGIFIMSIYINGESNNIVPYQIFFNNI